MIQSLKEWYGRLKCYNGYHAFVYSPSGKRRACLRCGRREYMSFRSSMCVNWSEHTYPLDADPAKDPSRYCIDDFQSTLGFDYEFREIFDKYGSTQRH